MPTDDTGPPSSLGNLSDDCEPPINGPQTPSVPVRQGNEHIVWHPKLNGLPCDGKGEFLMANTPPSPWEDRAPDDYTPFKSLEDFLLADLLFRRNQMPQDHINDLMQYWARALPPGCDPPFASAEDLYETIDSSELGHIPWQSFSVSFKAKEGDALSDVPWKLKEYDIWYRNPREVLKVQLENRAFASEMDFAAKCVLDSKGIRRFQDFMSGEWAWDQSDILAQDEKNWGATFCPIMLGSDKTTVSVATGQNEYYPLYMSNGLIHNNVRRAHRNGVSLIAFLAIPKTDREHDDSNHFRQFRRELFHASITFILQALHPGMIEPEIIRYADGYYRRTLYGLGAYIADYPEQVILSCIVQDWCPLCTASNKKLDGENGQSDRRAHILTQALMEAKSEKALWFEHGIVAGIMPFTFHFPHADIHSIIAPDILHQLIKGTFKDHLVTWVEAYIKHEHPARRAKEILADIDRRIAAAPPFANLRRFPEGRGFKQWTGDDSKALMKVYLPAIIGYVPPMMVRAISTFMDFCYIVRRSVIDEDDLDKLDSLLAKFHEERKIFQMVGIQHDGFNLPRQHSLTHYHNLIRKFGAPNGLCSSITESKHIKAVKEPWQRSNRFNALSQMLLTNQRLDKLAACTADFRARQMLDNSLWAGRTDPPPTTQQPAHLDDDEDDDGGAVDDRELVGDVKLAQKPVRNIPRNVQQLARWLHLPSLPLLISQFLYSQEHPEHTSSLSEINCPQYTGKVYLYPSAIATYYAPSDVSGMGGMLRERIRSTRSWRNGPARYDCIFVEHDSDLPGFRGMYAAQVLALIKIKQNRVIYPCAVVSWFLVIGNSPCPDTGMWMVYRERDECQVIHLDTIIRAAHLVGIAGTSTIPYQLDPSDSLKAFNTFYVNKFIDYHAHEIAF